MTIHRTIAALSGCAVLMLASAAGPASAIGGLAPLGLAPPSVQLVSHHRYHHRHYSRGYGVPYRYGVRRYGSDSGAGYGGGNRYIGGLAPGQTTITAPPGSGGAFEQEENRRNFCDFAPSRC